MHSYLLACLLIRSPVCMWECELQFDWHMQRYAYVSVVHATMQLRFNVLFLSHTQQRTSEWAYVIQHLGCKISAECKKELECKKNVSCIWRRPCTWSCIKAKTHSIEDIQTESCIVYAIFKMIERANQQKNGWKNLHTNCMMILRLAPSNSFIHSFIPLWIKMNEELFRKCLACSFISIVE